MTTVPEARPSRKRRSLRHRMIVSLTGLAVLPLLAALVALFFVVRDDVGSIHGSQLAQETRQLSEQLHGELQRIQQTADGLAASPEVTSSLERLRKGTRGEVVLFTAKGERLAGNPTTPLPPAEAGGPGWMTFTTGNEQYFAGVTAVRTPGGAEPRDWFLAVVQPAAQVFGHCMR